MGTQRYSEDISEAAKKFLKANQGQKPTKLKVRFLDAMDWFKGAGSTRTVQDFVNQEVKSYANTIPFRDAQLRRSTLDCEVELLKPENDTPTHFE
jgi:hypothetical protein